MPEFDDKSNLSKWIDENISAEFPTMTENFISEEDQKYYEMVETYMIHKCSSGTVNSCLDSDGVCSKHYTTNKIQAHTTFNERGFPEYKRRTYRSLKVVPHNKRILLAWNGHANVEFAGSTLLVIYLYKVYIYFIFIIFLHQLYILL